MLNNYKVKLFISLLVVFGLAFVCSSSKDEKKDEVQKESTKKEEVSSSSAKLYFCEQYTDHEINKSDVFLIASGGGYFTCMIDLRPTGKTVGVGKLDIRISKITGDGEKILETVPFDVQPDWDYIHFDEFYTFKSDGQYKVLALKPDGTSVASGEVSIKYK